LQHKALIAQGRPYQGATELGDLYYKRSLIDSRGQDKQIEIFYHTFTIAELRDELNRAGLKDFSIGVASLLPPADLSFHPLLHSLDGWASDAVTWLGSNKFLPASLLSQSSYLMCDWDKCQYQHASKALGRLATSNSALISR
jgi:hypothetical protein